MDATGLRRRRRAVSSRLVSFDSRRTRTPIQPTNVTSYRVDSSLFALLSFNVVVRTCVRVCVSSQQLVDVHQASSVS